jgi:hypothetical protein
VHAQPEPDVLGHRQVREQQRFLEHQTDGPPLGRDAEDGGTIEGDVAGIRGEQPGQQRQCGALAAARWAEQGSE